MLVTRILFSIIIVTLFISCGNDKPVQPGQAAADTLATSAFNPKAHLDSMMANDQVLSTHNNTLSPFKFVTTTPEFSKFGAFVKASSYAKELHNGNWALLAPTDLSFSNYNVEALALIRLPENQKMCDAFIEKHILKMPFSIYKLTDLEQAETITGKKIKVDEKTLTIGGARYSGVEFNTSVGRVISMDEPIGLPFDELETMLKKQQSK